MSKGPFLVVLLIVLNLQSRMNVVDWVKPFFLQRWEAAKALARGYKRLRFDKGEVRFLTLLSEN
jgi:hypothetical protein